MKRACLVVALIVVCFQFCGATEYPYIYKGVRPMGMGGAFVAVSNDENALFYNPSGLADIKTRRSSILPLEIEVGENTYSLYRDALDVDFNNEQETAQFLRENIGERSHLGLYAFPHFSMPRFAFCLIGTARMDIEVRDRQYPKVLTDVVNDFGAGVGYAHPLFNGTVLVGASVKYIRRQSLDKEYTVLDIVSKDLDDLIQDDLDDGTGFLLDAGVIVRLDGLGVKNTRIGVSGNNMIGGDLGDARDLDEHIDIGISHDLDLGFTRATLAFDYTDLFSQIEYDDDLAKRIRFGVEFRCAQILSLRTGLYQGYLTGGLGIDGKGARLDVLTYAEEIGAFAGQRIDRRYLLRFSIGF
ncbi:MAG: conjugal transfer protein TraF [Desulfomonilia bacterium]